MIHILVEQGILQSSGPAICEKAFLHCNEESQETKMAQIFILHWVMINQMEQVANK